MTVEHLLMACIFLMFARDMINEINKKGANNGKKERQHEIVGLGGKNESEVHKESKPEGRVHSNRSPVPTEDSD
jgi:hypothetical protein